VCTTITEAIVYAKSCVEVTRYELQIHFEGNNIHHEIIEEKHILVQFLEAFL
jgi:hypothetical protein